MEDFKCISPVDPDVQVELRSLAELMAEDQFIDNQGRRPEITILRRLEGQSATMMIKTGLQAQKALEQGTPVLSETLEVFYYLSTNELEQTAFAAVFESREYVGLFWRAVGIFLANDEGTRAQLDQLPATRNDKMDSSDKYE